MKTGSSPLARGLHEDSGVTVGRPGIIPARAGFTSYFGHCPSGSRDHPRSRGVYRVLGGFPDRTQGSSPLARGLPYLIAAAIESRGIIPARAGFTSTRRSTSTGTTDHPRSRGVYASTVARVAIMHGSSPLARGLPRRQAAENRGVGIIPARAGFTLHLRGTDPPEGDHPRSRGVYARIDSDRRPGDGSSPLARGLRPGPT